MDVVKSRMQVYSAGGKAVGALEVIRMLVKEGGIFIHYVKNIYQTSSLALKFCLLYKYS